MAFTYEEIYKELTDVKPDIKSLKENCLTFTDAACYIAECAEKEFYELFKVVGVNELAYYKAHGEVIVYEDGEEGAAEGGDDKAAEAPAKTSGSAAKSGFLANVKKFFVNLWAKIKAIFTKVVEKIQTITFENLEKHHTEIVKGYNVLVKDKEACADMQVYHYDETIIGKVRESAINYTKQNWFRSWQLFKKNADKKEIFHGNDSLATNALRQAGVKVSEENGLSANIDAFKTAVKGEQVALDPNYLVQLLGKFVANKKSFTGELADVKKDYAELKATFASVISDMENGNADEVDKKYLKRGVDQLQGLNQVIITCESLKMERVAQAARVAAKCIKAGGGKVETTEKDKAQGVDKEKEIKA